MSVELPVICRSCGWQGRRNAPSAEYRGPLGPCPKCGDKVRAVGSTDQDQAALEHKMQRAAGELGEARIWRQRATSTLRAQMKCLHPDCRRNDGGRWRSASDGAVKGQGSSIEFALDLWANHLDKKHQAVCPWSTAPNRGAALAAHNEAEASWWDAFNGEGERP